MISDTSRPYIQASVPVLKEVGLTITRRFYASMLSAHPELNNVFNQGNQASEAQQQSLASAVFAYAANIDAAPALAPVIERIAHKHASLGIRSHHYPIVGRHLLGAISEVLGSAATPALMAAWDEAYWLLAGALIEAEARLYERSSAPPGALLPLRVAAVESEGEGLVSLVLTTEDGTSPGTFVPGQYVSVEVQWPDTGRRQRRQYSLSDAPGQPHWRITVKRETQEPGKPQGQVSNWIHDRAHVGSVLQCSPPFGEFRPGGVAGEGPALAPQVLIAAGVGITPMMSWLKHWADLAYEGDATSVLVPEVHLLYAARSVQHHPLQADLAALQRKMKDRLHTWICYEALIKPSEAGHEGRSPDATGLLDVSAVLPSRLGDRLRDAQVFMCGPGAFMREQALALQGLHVPAHHIYREVFGPEMFA